MSALWKGMIHILDSKVTWNDITYVTLVTAQIYRGVRNWDCVVVYGR